jgi:HlyD family secretion protein
MSRYLRPLPLLALVACGQTPESNAPIYEAAPVETRSIEVTVDAAGVIEPETVVDVKSKASGEILALHAETGDVVEAGALLVEIDKRIPRNRLSEAEASLIAAQARQRIAETQMKRAETLFKSGTLTQADYEQSQLEFANSKAQVVSAEVALESARIAMDDTDVRAPIRGTIIQKYVEPGTVISSPTQDVGGGTLLIKMADLASVQVRALVDETDIGKIQPGMDARVTVAAYPNQPFDGQVLKIEPQAVVEQNVTMFAVLIRLENRGGLLKPGMNADVAVRIAARESVPAVPTAALRTDDDLASTAQMLALDVSVLRSELAAANGGATDLNKAGAPAPGGSAAPAAGGDVQALMAKRRNGETLTSEERARLRAAFAQSGGGVAGRPPLAEAGPGAGEPPGGGTPGAGGGSRRSRAPSTDYQFEGRYWVIVLRDGKPVAVPVRTGLTDMAYSEVVSGLGVGDQVLLLPSTSLYEQQQRLQTFIAQRFSSSTPFQAPR